MSRSPLFSLVRRALRRARREQLGRPLVSPLAQALPINLDRRRFLLGGAGAALTLPLLHACGSSLPQTLPVAIVGGGMGGVHAAYRLKQRGLLASIFEASTRLGGRMYTDRVTFAAPSGQHCELGGELIDSSHATIRDLASELGVELLNYHTDDASLSQLTAYLGGRSVTEAELLSSFAPIAAAIDHAWESAVDPNAMPSYTNENGMGDYDRMSISGFLDQVGASGPARQLIEIAYTVEYGLEVSEQSALNLLWLISTDTEHLRLFGDSNECFHCATGNDTLPLTLAAALDPSQVALEHRLVALSDEPGGRYRLTFDRPDGTRDVLADRVVLAIPFTLLRQVDLSELSLPDIKRKAIAELGYGTNSKLMVGFASRPWRALGSNGQSFSDLGYQNTWETSRLQPGMDGIVTNFVGGQTGVRLGDGSDDKQRDGFLMQIDQVYPGTAAASTGKVARFVWPSHPYTLGSYACYKVGQWTTLSGAEFERVGNVLFCGEHTSLDAQGFMEGAALTGAMVAEAIGADLSLPAISALNVPARRIAARAKLALLHGSWIRALTRAA